MRLVKRVAPLLQSNPEYLQRNINVEFDNVMAVLQDIYNELGGSAPATSPPGWSVPTDHAALQNLDYAFSGHSGFEPSVTPTTSDDYYRGDKVFAALNSAAVGLTNVLNVAQEPDLGAPAADGYILSSTIAKVRSWIVAPSGTTDHAALSNLAYAAAGHTGFEPTISAGTTGQYWRGDKSWQTLNSSAVGLGNVTNIAQAPVSSTFLTNGADGTLTNEVNIQALTSALSFIASNDVVPITIKGSGSQTADLLDMTDNGATIYYTKFYSNGRLDIQTQANALTMLLNKAAAQTNGPRIDLQQARGTIASPTAVQSSDSLGTLRFSGRKATAYAAGAQMYVYASETWDDTHSGTGIAFYTTPTGGTAIAVGLWVLPSGAIQTLPTYSATVGATNRDLYIDDTGVIGYVSSSRRYKENIRDLEDIHWLSCLRPVLFDRILGMKGEMGLVAEEVAEVNPSVVSFDDKGLPETVQYKALITPMLLAIQRLEQKVEALSYGR